MDEQLIAQMREAEQHIFRMAENDPQLAALVPDAAITAAAQAPGLSYREILDIILRGYADRPALGTRACEVTVDPETGKRIRRILPQYATITYSELHRQIEAIAGFWQHGAAHRVEPGDMVAFLAFNGAEMTAVDLACTYINAIVVPLQANYAAHDLDQMLSC